MTKKEVIYFLDQVRKILLDDKSWLESTIQPINEAFDMAIKALDQSEPCNDDKGCSNCMYSGRPTYKSPCSECRDNSQWETKPISRSHENGTECEDTISRQEAIDVLLEEVRLVDGYYVENDEVIDKDDAIEAIRLLPPVQPEIMRCGDCKHYYFADNRIPQEQWYTCELDGDRWRRPDDYCSFAVRRTDGQVN